MNPGGNVSLFLGEINAFNTDLLALLAFHNGPWDSKWILIPAGDVNLLNRQLKLFFLHLLLGRFVGR